MEAVIAPPKAKAKRTLKEPKLEQPKEQKLEQPKAKAKTKAKLEQPKEQKLEQPKAKTKAKEPQQLILQSEKDELVRAKLKLRQSKEAERVYNNAISKLNNT